MCGGASFPRRAGAAVAADPRQLVHWPSWRTGASAIWCTVGTGKWTWKPGFSFRPTRYPGFLGQQKPHLPHKCHHHPLATQKLMSSMCACACSRISVTDRVQAGSFFLLFLQQCTLTQPPGGSQAKANVTRPAVGCPVGGKSVRLKLPLTGGQESATTDTCMGNGLILGLVPQSTCSGVGFCRWLLKGVWQSLDERSEALRTGVQAHSSGSCRDLGRLSQTSPTGCQPCPSGDQLKELSTRSPPHPGKERERRGAKGRDGEGRGQAAS